MNLKEKYFSKRQESTRKDVERLFGCLQSRFKILRREWFEWDINFVVQVSEVCIILHNMLVELRRDGKLDDEFDANGNRIHDESVIQEFMELPAEGLEGKWSAEYGFTNATGGTWCVNSALGHILANSDVVMNRDIRNVLVSALTDHLWVSHSSSMPLGDDSHYS
jgi:hypothetical protein